MFAAAACCCQEPGLIPMQQCCSLSTAMAAWSLHLQQEVSVWDHCSNLICSCEVLPTTLSILAGMCREHKSCTEVAGNIHLQHCCA
jgi:hypothetical protein